MSDLDDGKPHFSLRKMSAIPAYRGAKQLLYDMFNDINKSRHFGYRKSWEILIEVLAHHLGIVQNPWLYSEPNRDTTYIRDPTSPLKCSAFKVDFPDRRLNLLRSILGLPAKKIVIRNPAKPHHIIYYADRFTPTPTQRKIIPKSKDVAFFLQHFERKGTLERYVTNARIESIRGSNSLAEGVDHLGAIFNEYELAGRSNRMGQCLTPTAVVDFIVKSAIGIKPINRVETVMDPCTGTGRFLIEASRLNRHRPLQLFGVELDPIMYRATLVNMAIYSEHPYSILCANTLLLNQDVTTPEGCIWDKGNLWEPPDMSAYYYYKEAAPRKFTLANYSAETQEEETIEKEVAAILPDEPQKPEEEPMLVQVPTSFSLSAYAKRKTQK
jgi:hypothetical protein